MKCFYINLDSETERRSAIEKNFSSHAKAGWELVRVPAVDTRQVEERRVRGSLRPAEKACFLSHQSILETQKTRQLPL
jgi:GR25 family glycosyltransferase involved in LPS biosynthesis